MFHHVFGIQICTEGGNIGAMNLDGNHFTVLYCMLGRASIATPVNDEAVN